MRLTFSILLTLFAFQLMVDCSHDFWDSEGIELADTSEDDTKDQQEDEFFDTNQEYLSSTSLIATFNLDVNYKAVTSPEHLYQDVYIQVPHSPPDNLY